MIISKETVIIAFFICIIIGSFTACIPTNRQSHKSKKLHKQKNSLIGQKAPDFTFFDETNNSTTLYAFSGIKRALIFYPKDGSPFCTEQLCSIRDNKAILEEENIMAIGISPDSQESHDAFKEKKGLSILLISDPKKEIAQLYHATGGWFGYNKRITILIDENNIVIDVIDNIKITDHAQQIIDGFTKK